jgi:pilus assembly protein Flp/PilA
VHDIAGELAKDSLQYFPKWQAVQLNLAVKFNAGHKEHLMNIVSRFLKDQSGATAIEYGLIAGLIAVVIITSVTAIGTKMSAKFTTISNSLT